jgi:hypothetical protein
MDRTQIIERAMGLVQAVSLFTGRARAYFYAVVLSDRVCPNCEGALTMEREGRCRCCVCGRALDPTIAFQSCSSCGGRPRLRVRRYECSQCGHEVTSRYLFEGLAFDAEYFREKMAEHRQRQRDLRDRVRQMLAGTRSGAIEVPPIEVMNASGLFAALNQLGSGSDLAFAPQVREGFDLKQYQNHILACLRPFPLALDDLPPLRENARIDRIRRFIAILFLAHAGIVDVWQHGEEIMVMPHEADREGQDVSGDLEADNGVEGALGRVEAG